jgi:hypothetical protein
MASIISQIAAAVPTVQTNPSPDPNAQWSIKFQSYTTDPGGVPVTGFPEVDYRGKDPTSATQDEHHTWFEHKDPSDLEIEAFLASGPIINAELYGLSPGELGAKLESLLPASLKPFIDSVVKAVGGIPNFRILLVDAHG